MCLNCKLSDIILIRFTPGKAKISLSRRGLDRVKKNENILLRRYEKRVIKKEL